MVVNLVGDFPSNKSDLLKHHLIGLLNTLNKVHGWLLVCGEKIIELVGNLLENEARNVVDEMDHQLVCIAIAPLGVLSDQARMRILGVFNIT